MEFEESSGPAGPIFRPPYSVDPRAPDTGTGVEVAIARNGGLTVTVLERLLDLEVLRAGLTAAFSAWPFATIAADEDEFDRVVRPADRVGSREEEETEGAVEV